jgi:hypothetical protein
MKSVVIVLLTIYSAISFARGKRTETIKMNHQKIKVSYSNVSDSWANGITGISITDKNNGSIVKVSLSKPLDVNESNYVMYFKEFKLKKYPQISIKKLNSLSPERIGQLYTSNLFQNEGCNIKTTDFNTAKRIGSTYLTRYGINHLLTCFIDIDLTTFDVRFAANIDLVNKILNQ